MLAAELTAGTYCAGLLYRFDGDRYVTEVPHVHRARKIRKSGVVTEVHVTWTNGQRGTYPAGAHLEAL